jgi:glucose-1-phosphate cytidylyltransferase
MHDSGLKTVILAGGFGTRLAEETDARPKPMVEIGGRPILWHIMKHYSFYGCKEFILALGYKSEVIKTFFRDYCGLVGSMSIEMAAGRVARHGKSSEDWIVHLIDTGLFTNTGGRLKRLEAWLHRETFMVTYGDGVADIDLEALLMFHRQRGTIATVTAVRPPARFGGLVLEGDRVTAFTEKSQIGEGWINGGFLVCEPEIFDYLSGDEVSLEADALASLANEGQLAAYRHEGFWQCMDTLRDKRLLDALCQGRRAPWKGAA